MQRTMVVVAVLAIGAALVGCGGGNSPKATYERMWKAAEAGDRQAVLACFTNGSQAKILELEKMAADLAPDKAGEAKPLDKLMAQAKSSICEIGEQKIRGDHATLLVSIDGKPKPTQFLREGGAWKIDISADLAKLEGGLKFFKGLKDIGDRLKAKRP
jgi:hypothetical protein